ncbi:MAG: glutamate synthase subunit beta [Cyclobacteriaceae bacterium]|nr:glutamate synthase subunit beta [Cyclobacteriaceae bacterium]
MGKIDGFLLFDRELPESRNPVKRIKDYKEIYKDFPAKKTVTQASRCMDCGVPFCMSGCPLENNIPEFNDAVYNEDWTLAVDILKETNNFPEFTGRICPAPCEGSCVLGINKPQITIEHIEKTIAEKAYELGLMKADPPLKRTGKKVAVIGSGPAGLATADQLNKSGHTVEVFERDSHVGGLLRFGIPDFKLEKWVVERRVNIMKEEGVVFHTNSHVGKNVDGNKLANNFDALVLCGGSTVPRDLPIPGRELNGVHFAMEFLTRQNKVVSGEKVNDFISAEGKNIIVIGGGDTGSDCVGTSNRHKAKSVTQIELLPTPPTSRTIENPWPEWPMILRSSSSHEEGCTREWSIITEEFIADDKGNVKAIKITEIEWYSENGQRKFKKIEGSTRELPCDLAFLAMGFLYPEKEGVLAQLGIDTNERGNVDDANYKTNVDKIFTAGDMRRGQSLVVWAIREGREAAKEVDAYLTQM